MHGTKDFLGQMYNTDSVQVIEKDLQLIEQAEDHYNYVLNGGVLLQKIDYSRTRFFLNNN